MIEKLILAVAILLTLGVIFIRVSGLKYFVAYIFLKFFAKKPDRRWLISSRTSDYSLRKRREKMEKKQQSSDITLITERSQSVLSDVDSEKIKFEDAVVEIFKRKVKSLPEKEDLKRARSSQQYASEANLKYFDCSQDVSSKEVLRAGTRRVTYPPGVKDISKRDSHVERKESVMKKLTEHREFTKSRMEESSPVFFYRSSKEEGYVWLELSRHFGPEHKNLGDIMNFYAFDENGNFIAIWAMRSALDCLKDKTATSNLGASSSHFHKKIGDSQQKFFEQETGEEIKCMCEMFIFLHLEGFGSFQGSNAKAPIMCPCGTTTQRPKAIVEEPFFNSCGLKLECVEAMSKWKITFKGSLSKVEEPDSCEANVQFSFWWNAVSHPFHFQHEQSNKCLAKAVAREIWSKQFFKDFGSWRLRKEIYYSQWGGMRGNLRVDDFEKVMNFRGPRSHFYGTMEFIHNRPSTMWMIYTEKGHMAHLESTMVRNILKDLKLGYVSNPNGCTHKITRLTLKNEMLSRNKINHTEWKFNFSTDYHSEDIECEVTHTMKTKLHNEVIFQFAKIRMSGVKGYAVVRLFNSQPPDQTFRNDRKCAQLSFKENQLVQKDVDTWTIPFSSPLCINIALVGVEGCYLAYLFQIPNRKYEIADGFCLTTNALEYHLFHHPSVRKAINQLKKKTTLNSPDLPKDCEEVETLLQETPLLNEIIWELEDVLMTQFGAEFGNKAFTIRMSTSIRDGIEVLAESVTPMQDVKGLEKIIKGITRCWSIPYSYESVIHRKQNGLRIDILVSLIIQEMIYPKVTGVINTCDTNLRSPEGIVISLTEGIKTKQLEVLLSKSCDGSVSIVEMYVKDGDRAEPWLSLKGKRKDNIKIDFKKFQLSEKLLVELSTIAKEIEDDFGNPQKIEFAIVENDVKYLLKAMPITITMKSDDWLIMHEFDSSLATDYEIIVKDIINGPATPLTISMIMPAFNEAFVKFLKGVAVYGESRIYEKLLIIFQNRILVNTHQAMMLGASVDFPGCKRIMELCIIGKNLPIDYESYHPRFNYWKKIINAISVLQVAISASKKHERLQRLCDSIDFTSKAPQTSRHHYGNITRNIPIYYRSFHYYLSCFSAPNIWMYILKTYLKHKRKEWTVDNSYMETMMLSTYDREELSTRFQELLIELIKNNEAAKFVKATTEKFYDWLKSPSSGLCGDLFQNLLTNHGHRCLNEFEFFEKSWHTEPLNFAKIVQSMVEKSSKDVLVIKQKETFQMKGFGIFKRLVINFFLKKIFKCLKLREQARSTLIQLHSKFREAYWLLADKMIQEGRLPSHDLLFFLTHLEIGTLLLTRSPRLLSLAKSRKRATEKLVTVSIPNIIIGFDYESIGQDGVIKKRIILGTPITDSNVTAKVRVIHTHSDLASIEKGEIVVTSFFEPTWSFCLSYIAGIITEQGGMLTYGAMYARKYGLPCIIDADGATSSLISGDTISLDGKAGMIQKITIH